MYKDSKRTCTAIVLLIKPFVWRRSRCRRRRVLLKLPINNQIQTDLHTKPTDKHQYLLRSSCHPAHTKRTIPFSLALRLRRICSTDHFFNKRCYAELINYLALRGYSRRRLFPFRKQAMPFLTVDAIIGNQASHN